MIINLDELDKLSADELKTAHHKIGKALESFHSRKIAEARAKAEVMMKELGVSLDEVFNLGGEGAQDKPKRIVAPKYIDPTDGSKTWTGRGKKPKWVEAQLEAGKTLDDLLIKTDA